MLRKALKLATIAAGVVLSACSDSHPLPTLPLAPGTPGASAQVVATSPDLLASIDALITASWSHGLAQGLSSQWTDVLRDLASGKPDAKTRRKFNLVVDWIQKKTPDITAPLGETQTHVAARLILYMSLYVYRDPMAPPPAPPPLTVTTDIVAAVVQPAAPATITTPTQHATVIFQAGAVSEPTVVVIALETNLYPRNCSGPLVTKRCQYPQFYKYNVFPDVRLNTPAKVGVCHVNSGTNRVPLRPGIHSRFQLAHDLPASAANYTPNATQEGGIEILPLVDVGTALNCSQTNTYGAAFFRTQPGALGAVVDRTQWLVGRVASAVKRALSPKEAYAIDVGGGGETFFFSTFADVDPVSLPDLQPAGFAVQESAVFAGETVHITALAATNAGTASAGATTTSIRLSTDSTITTADPELASQVQPAMVPYDTTSGTPVGVVIPAGTAPGTYYIGMLTDAGNTESEESETNNFVSIRFTVKRIVSTTTITCPASASYTGTPRTPCTVAVTGASLNLAPEPTYTNNTNIGTATATYNYLGDATYAPSTDTKTFQITVPEASLVINPASVEKLPGGTQAFSVVSGGPGPYTWSVNGVAGGNATYGTITSGGAYTAPAAVPTPATFNVCAQMQSPPLNTGCASVTIKPIPSTGGEVVVFNDINLFDAGASSTNNNQFYRNLVQFTAPGARASQTGVMMHRGHSSRCGYAGGPCVSGALAGFYSVLTGAGFNITDIDNSSAAITSIPASIKVLFLWNPVTSYASAEINVMKQFASEGGRIIFIGEWDGYYGTAGIATENAFFASMGAQMTNQGGAYDCGRVDLPASSLRPHQITAGMNGLRIGCASRVLPGPNDYPLFYNTGNTIVLGAVAKVDLTPLSSASFLASAQGIRVPKTPSKVEASAGMEYVSWSDVPVPKP